MCLNENSFDRLLISYTCNFLEKQVENSFTKIVYQFFQSIFSSYRSNCDSAAANTLRQHYQRPYFLSQDMESSKTDWIFMGTPGYGAHIHVKQFYRALSFFLINLLFISKKKPFTDVS